MAGAGVVAQILICCIAEFILPARSKFSARGICRAPADSSRRYSRINSALLDPPDRQWNYWQGLLGPTLFRRSGVALTIDSGDWRDSLQIPGYDRCVTHYHNKKVV